MHANVHLHGVLAAAHEPETRTPYTLHPNSKSMHLSRVLDVAQLAYNQLPDLPEIRRIELKAFFLCCL
jgi:hypothetical protein